jgi:Secretion system C-terminal sorting domain
VELKGKGKGLAVYPNPVSNALNVVYTEGSSFQILNLLGQQVLTGKTPPSGAGGLDVSALPQGTYILKVGAEQAKFLKQ